MKKSMTELEEQKLVEFRDKWLSIGLDCGPVDRVKFENAVCGLYAKLDKPITKRPIFIQCSSPLVALIFMNVIKKCDFSKLSRQLYSQLSSQLSSQIDSQLSIHIYRQLDIQLSSEFSSQLYSQLYRQLYRQLDRQLYSQIYRQLDSQLYGQLSSELSSQLSRQLYSQIYSQLYRQLDSQIYSQLDSQLYRQLDIQLSSQLSSQIDSQKLEWFSYWGGQCWSSYPAFYLFPYETFKNYEYKKSDLESLQLWADISASVNWWWSFEDFVFFSDKPKHIKRDERGQLHCEDDKALKYKDGYGLYAWHGIMTTEKVIMRPQEITVDMILKEDNQEVRRVLMERMGIRRFLIEAKPVVLDEDSHKINWNRALFKIKNDVFLYVADPSTGRNYPIQVDSTCKTCEEADNWMWHGRKALDGKPYKQISRT